MESAPATMPPLPEPLSPPPIDIDALIDQSMPVSRPPISLYAAAGFGAALLVGAALQWQVDAGPVAGVFWSLALLGMLITLSWVASRSAGLQRQEIEAVETADELVETNRSGEAVVLLIGLLQQPVRLPGVRLRALTTLSRLLSRYGRYEQSMQVQDYLLSEPMLDPQLTYTLELGHTMNELRLDRLYDADRSINDLRRRVSRNESPDDADNAPIRIRQRDHSSSGLALVELYRDVKTGHFADALETYERRKAIFRQQMGHRFADVLAMTAIAADALGQIEVARSLFADATTLQPLHEITRRLPETTQLVQKYSPAFAPAEVL